MSNQSNPLRPTFEGLVASTYDSLVLFEACLSGRLTHVPRRPHDRERQDLIKSGNVFIYEEHASGIKRWTDGVSWSPSRILGNFLIYRELEKPFPPGEKKRALKRKKCPPGGIGKADSTSHLNMSGFTSPAAMDGVNIKGTERALIGSLVDSYPFKPGGLVKKTISVSYNGVPHHLVSYYKVDDAVAGNLNTPSRSYGFSGISPRNELLVSQNFRAPIDEVQYSPDDEGGGPSGLIATVVNAPAFSGGSHTHMPRAMSIAGFHAPVPAAYGSIPYTYHPQHQYLATMNSPMPVQMPQPLPSSIQPSLGSSAPQSIPPSISPAMPSSTPSMPYTPQPHGNYSLGPTRASRFSASTGMDNDFPRSMPLHDPPRRNSAFELTQPAELSSMHLGTVPGGRPPQSGNTYVGQGSYYVPQRGGQMAGQEGQAFNQPRPTKQDPNTLTGAEAGTQNYNLDQNPTDWALGQSDGQGDLQYFGNSASNGSEQWPGGSNGLGRS
ncbi:Gti1/Pac2 family protein [Metarhizium acridum CQMa 102]|uniref:Gti1/Pac2 family protein n=1 Tax=Metarhizium acridum (strain CQMa 102) TaxID=655827 RepID=E9DW94_METAQ|nr:Gti1/Pac2 family protein [Metarhizium acridum CQMa 102]EFY91944.1 Gti1/Pac2 family protein [Metarhizium acridum CQMa 102]